MLGRVWVLKGAVEPFLSVSGLFHGFGRVRFSFSMS